MVQEHKETGNTDLLLGEIKGSVKGIDSKLKVQNGAINGMRESINGLSSRIDKLPCDLHNERINNILTINEKEGEKETLEERSKRSAWRDLFVALTSAVFTGGIMLLGIWLSNAVPAP